VALAKSPEPPGSTVADPDERPRMSRPNSRCVRAASQQAFSGHSASGALTR
jgi:hypothetical protein